jgi:hypothetical protein
MAIPPIQNSALATERSLESLQTALARGKSYIFAKNKEGAIEITLKKPGLLARIRNWFTNSQKNLAKSFIAQTLNVVDNDGVSRNLRSNILLKVTDNSATSDIFNRVIKSAHAKKKSDEIHAKLALALDHIRGEPQKEVRGEPQKEVRGDPQKEAKEFKVKFDQGLPVTLFDSRPMVEYNYEQRLAGQPGDTALLARLRSYYADSHQAGGFVEIEVAARSAVLARSKNQLTSKSADFCRDVVSDIKNKANEHPSVHGHPRDLYTKIDVANLKAIVDKLPDSSQVRKEATDQLKTIEESVAKSNRALGRYSSLFQRLEGNKQSIPLIVEAKKALMEIELYSGRYLEIDLLKEHPAISAKNREGLENLAALDKMRSPDIDQAMLQSFIKEHDEASCHPRVAIEGAGPTGLLLAITQFRSGADVSIFEKRSTKFDRTQIVRLDPKWMAMLKVYLGEDYYKLFTDPGKKGILRSDGFGEISTMELEDILHNKLTQLISQVPYVKGKIPSLERLAAHEITQVNSPAVVGGKFQIVADYSERHDAANAPQVQTPDQQVRQIDMMITAGGKSSPMKDKFLPSSSPVNNKQNYGVCSWLSRTIPGQNLEKMDLFADFRNMIKVDQEFRNRFQAQLNDHFSPESLVGSTVDRHLMKGFSEQMNSSDFQKFMKNGPAQPFIQTRTFENRGLIYIGMEIPAEVHELFKNFDAKLDNIVSKGDIYIIEREKKVADISLKLDSVARHLNEAESPDSVNFYNTRKNALEKELDIHLAALETHSPGHAKMTQHKQFMMEMMRKVWFQNIMDTYGLSQKHGLTLDTIDTKFSAMFPVDQNRMHQNHSFSNIRSGNSELLVLAAGDAFASPHFMRYSGLTGARENILDYQNYTYRMTHHQKPDQKGLLDKLRNKGDRTATFVIDRGKAFLTPKTQGEIDRVRKEKLIELLDKEVADINPRPYSIKKIGDGRYEVEKGFQKVVVRPQEGWLRVEGSPKNFESFEQIKFELQLI